MVLNESISRAIWRSLTAVSLIKQTKSKIIVVVGTEQKQLILLLFKSLLLMVIMCFADSCLCFSRE